MLRFLVCFSLLLNASIAPAQQIFGVGHRQVFPPKPTFVQEQAAPHNPGSVTTSSFTCTAGDYLYIFAGTYSSSDTFTVTNTTGDSVTSVVSNKPAGDSSSQVFSVASCTGTTGTYTLTDGNGAYLDFAVLEFRNVHGVDVTNTCAGGSWGASCTITTVSANTYVIGSMETISLGPVNLAAGWTNYQSTISVEAALQGISQPNAALVTWAPPNGTNGGGTTDTEILVALK